MIAGLEEISSASESDISVIEPTNPFSIKRPHKKISSFNTFKPRWARSKLGSKLDAK